MTKLTKAQHYMLRSYMDANREGRHTLDDVYSRYSKAKELAYWNIVKEMDELGGCLLCITTANTFQFCCAYHYYDSEGHKRLRYHTRDNVYDFEI